MLHILFKQPLHLWRNLGRWTKIEVFLLVGLLYVYAAERLIDLLQTGMVAYAVNLWQVSWALLHLYVFVLLLTAPFIWFFVLPRQPALQVFYGKPLSSRHLMQMFGYYYQKFQILSLLIVLAVLFALCYLSLMLGVLLFALIAVYSAAVMIVSYRLFVVLRSKVEFFSALYMLAALHGGIALTALFYFAAAPVLDVLFFSGVGLLLRKTATASAQISLEQLYPPAGKTIGQKYAGRLTLNSFPRFLPRRVRVLFAKEFLNLWRNPAYRRLKLYTLLLYFGGQWAIYRTGRSDREMWMILLGLALIWLHYARYFNVKYLRPDPEWFFYTQPLRFSHFWLAGFSTEFLFVLLLVAGQSVFLTILGGGWLVQLNWLGVLLLFALIVLAVMLNFRIYFYDDPRMAGYAYHFMVLFFVVMSVNYRLVGPLMAMLFLIYFIYKSYRFFNG